MADATKVFRETRISRDSAISHTTLKRQARAARSFVRGYKLYSRMTTYISLGAPCERTTYSIPKDQTLIYFVIGIFSHHEMYGAVRKYVDLTRQITSWYNWGSTGYSRVRRTRVTGNNKKSAIVNVRLELIFFSAGI